MASQIRAIIWDLDGTLADTQMLHATIESDILSRFGVRISPQELTARFAGVKTETFFGTLLVNAGVRDFNLAALLEEKWARIHAHMQSICAMPGANALIEEFARRGFAQGVGSSSNAAYVTKVLEQLGFAQYISAIVGAEQVAQGKPAPDVFLRVSSLLGVSPQACIVFEDGASGIQAAKRAGMHCIGVIPPSYGSLSDVKNQTEKYPADVFFSSLEELSPTILDEILI